MSWIVRSNFGCGRDEVVFGRGTAVTLADAINQATECYERYFEWWVGPITMEINL